VPATVAAMATHTFAFLDGLGLDSCDVLGFSLGGMIAQRISQPTLIANGVHDEMIPVRNSCWLAEHLSNAVLLVYPDAGHGSLFQWHGSFQNHVSTFLASDSPFAPK
jgi:pimeloyl-ACP methyl ester carboxylesterase